MGPETEEGRRFRSFAERYVVERASTFRIGGDETEDAWAAILAAKSVYKMIDGAANEFRPQQAGAGQIGGATAPVTPPQAQNAVPISQTHTVARSPTRQPSPAVAAPPPPVRPSWIDRFGPKWRYDPGGD